MSSYYLNPGQHKMKIKLLLGIIFVIIVLISLVAYSMYKEENFNFGDKCGSGSYEVFTNPLMKMFNSPSTICYNDTSKEVSVRK